MQTINTTTGERVLYDMASEAEAGKGVSIYTPFTKLIDATSGSLRPVGVEQNPIHTQTSNRAAFLELIGVSRKRAKIFGKGLFK